MIRFKYPIIILILSLFISGRVSAQTDTSIYLNQGNQKEKLLENTDYDIEDSKLLDFLDKLEQNPYDLNSVTFKQLELIPFLNSITAKRIIEYREKNNYYKSKRELFKVDGVNENLYNEIKIYLIVKKSKPDIKKNDGDKQQRDLYTKHFGLMKNLEFRYRSRFQQELQPKAGYLNGGYAGSRAKLYNQIGFVNINSDYALKGNITIEKDAGETSLTDFYSAYLELKNYKFIKTAVIGDYGLNFGQGLGMWSSYSFSKGNIPVDPIKKKSEGIESYNSAGEVQFFRGAASKLNLAKDYNLFAFYSDNYLDASIDTTLDEAKSIYYDGYHRTASELSRKHSIKERLAGGRFLFDNNILRLGVTYWNARFSKPFASDSTTQLFNFTGDKANMLSADYDVIYKNINFYGEIARSDNGAVAGIGNFHFNLPQIADLVFSYRNYAKDFTPLHSFGFGEKSGSTQNETGFYTGVQLYHLKGLNINAYYDFFKFPYRTFSDAVPVTGNDFLLYSEWKAQKNLDLNLKFRNQNQEETRTITDIYNRNLKVIDSRNQLNLRLGFAYSVTENFRLRSRLEYIFVKYKYYGGDNKGFTVYTDLRFVPVPKLTFDIKLIYFQTDDYDSRIYAYEDDIRGVMSNFALYGKGSRWYILARYVLLNSLDLQVKYSETNLEGVKSIGSGNDLINGNLNNKLNLGMELRF